MGLLFFSKNIKLVTQDKKKLQLIKSGEIAVVLSVKLR